MHQRASDARSAPSGPARSSAPGQTSARALLPSVASSSDSNW